MAVIRDSRAIATVIGDTTLYDGVKDANNPAGILAPMVLQNPSQVGGDMRMATDANGVPVCILTAY
jgi:hypothetical protein